MAIIGEFRLPSQPLALPLRATTRAAPTPLYSRRSDWIREANEGGAEPGDRGGAPRLLGRA